MDVESATPSLEDAARLTPGQGEHLRRQSCLIGSNQSG